VSAAVLEGSYQYIYLFIDLLQAFRVRRPAEIAHAFVMSSIRYASGILIVVWSRVVGKWV
jgi:hypothetical protein